MKLYATVTSERASKGQGGNEYLRIAINILDEKKPSFLFIAKDNGNGEIDISFHSIEFQKSLLRYTTTFFYNVEPKGKQQKGEICGMCKTPITDKNLRQRVNGEPRHTSCS